MTITGESIDMVPALIVEDDPEMQRRLVRLLADLLGHDAQVGTAGDIASAKAQFGEHSATLALIDISLLDGISTPPKSGVADSYKLGSTHADSLFFIHDRTDR
ncbi:response regulator [Dyella tabacisoli]|uniref:Response regulator n=1 Tax=Dyella tabacisoli TaxID=2282381 RepID=A0A369UMI3_9GAMM|nr:response regulator [Dyella tabacisoli]RDD81741.1 response regulator [Dyella tabacisoli]